MPGIELKSYEITIKARVTRGLQERAILLSHFDEVEGDRGAELERCERSFVYWCNRWVWTHDPRLLEVIGVGKVPFELTEKQVEFADWIDERLAAREDGIVEKSRGQGATWIFVAKTVWWLLFKRNFSVSVGSRREDLVDEIGNMDSIFEKVRFIFDNLPTWMMEKCAKLDKKFMLIRNLRTESALKGEAGDNIGRGGRNSLYWIDEHAHLQHAAMIESALVTNAPSIFRISTPTLAGVEFAKLLESGMPKFTLYWKDNPLCDEEWFEDMCKKCGHDPLRIAQELELGRGAALTGLIIPPEWVDAAVELDLGEPDGDCCAGFDVAGGGAADNALVTRRAWKILNVLVWSGTEDVPGSVYEAVKLAKENNVEFFAYDEIGIGGSINGTLMRMEKLPFEWRGVNASSNATDVILKNGQKASEFLLNLKAQLWWYARDLFLDTFRYVNGDKTFGVEELVSIPNHQKLRTQLSQPTIQYTSRGKIRVESKFELKKRGIPSHDVADALVMSYARDVLGCKILLTDTKEEPAYDARKDRRKPERRPGMLSMLRGRHRLMRQYADKL